MILDFTMTACRRPAVLYRTLRSFADHLRGVHFSRCDLFVNVDPIPTDGSTLATLEVCDEFFRSVYANEPIEPSFPAALKWCWSKPRTVYSFHLEDDWELIEPVDVADLVAPLELDSQLSCVNLRAYRFPPGDNRICLSPALWRGGHARMLSSHISLDANPEQQLRPASIKNPRGGKHEGFYGRQWPDNPRHPVIRDIGREWLDKSGWRKEVDERFTRWVEV